MLNSWHTRRPKSNAVTAGGHEQTKTRALSCVILPAFVAVSRSRGLSGTGGRNIAPAVSGLETTQQTDESSSNADDQSSKVTRNRTKQDSRTV